METELETCLWPEHRLLSMSSVNAPISNFRGNQMPSVNHRYLNCAKHSTALPILCHLSNPVDSGY